MSGLSISRLASQQSANLSVKTENTASQDIPMFSSYMKDTTAKSKEFNTNDTVNKTDSGTQKSVGVTEKGNSKVADKIAKTKTTEKDNEYSVAELVANGSIDKDCISQEVLEQVTVAVKGILMDKLGVSEDVLQSMMDALSLSDEDLLNDDNIKALVMLYYGISDSVELMMDEEAYQTLMDVVSAVETATTELCEQAGMTVEELQVFAELNANTTENADFTGMQLEETMDGEISMKEVSAVASDVTTENGEGVTETADDIIVEVKKTPTDVTQSENKVAIVQEGASSENAENQNPMAGNQEENSAMEDGEQNQTIGNVQTTVQTIATENGVQTVFTRLTDALDMVKQIVEQIRVQITPDTTSMEMQLNPENLGKVTLNVSAKNGIITAQMTVENDAVKAAVESQMLQLKESLNNQGLKVEAIEVSVETRSFERQEQNSGQGKQNAEEIVEKQNTIRRRNINLREALAEGGMQEDGLTEEELLTQKLMKAHGNTLDFMA